MSKYIDAEKLITIIEERKAQQDQWVNRYHDPINQGISQELTEILSTIASLQQEPAKWNEEDETIIDCAVEIVEKAGLPSLAASLKSLRPQPILTPSKEQMEALMYATGEGGTYNKEALKSLMDDLKKRM